MPLEWDIRGSKISMPIPEMDAAVDDLRRLGADVAGGPRRIGASAAYALAVHAKHKKARNWFLNAITQHGGRILKGLVERAMSGGPKAARTKGKVLAQAGELILGEAIRKAPVRTGFLKRSHFNIEDGKDIPTVRENTDAESARGAKKAATSARKSSRRSSATRRRTDRTLDRIDRDLGRGRDVS